MKQLPTVGWRGKIPSFHQYAMCNRRTGDPPPIKRRPTPKQIWKFAAWVARTVVVIAGSPMACQKLPCEGPHATRPASAGVTLLFEPPWTSSGPVATFDGDRLRDLLVVPGKRKQYP